MIWKKASQRAASLVAGLEAEPDLNQKNSETIL